MNEIMKCDVLGCNGDMVKSGSTIRSGKKVQRFECRKCGATRGSDILYEGSGKRIKEKESLKVNDTEKPISDEKHQLLAPKCKNCGEIMTRTYVYRKQKNSKSGNWIPIGWSCILCQKMKFTTPECDASVISISEQTHDDQPSSHKEIKPKDERFCADIVVTGIKPVPQGALDQLKRVSEMNRK